MTLQVRLPRRLTLRGWELVTHYQTAAYAWMLFVGLAYLAGKDASERGLPDDWPIGLLLLGTLGAIILVSGLRQWKALEFVEISTQDDEGQNFARVHDLADRENWRVQIDEHGRRLQMLVPENRKELCSARRVTVLFAGRMVAINCIADVSGTQPGVTWGRTAEIIDEVKGVLRVI